MDMGIQLDLDRGEEGGFYYEDTDIDYGYGPNADEMMVDVDYGAPIYLDENNQYSPKDIHMIWQVCCKPSILQISKFLGTLFLWNLIFRIIAQRVRISPTYKHIGSIILGILMAMQALTKFACLYYLSFTVFTYILCSIVNLMRFKYKGLFLCSICLGMLGVCEFLESDTQVWQSIRGTIMIVAMKVVSLGFDMESGIITRRPNIWEYFGYLMCPANNILGPWISFKDYLQVYKKGQIKWVSKWPLWICVNFTLSTIFLLNSNCLVDALIPDFSIKWLMVYKDALTYRFSHYFVCFMSQMAMTTAGYTSASSSSARFFLGYQITQPFNIEFPRSLVDVVVVWNTSMHTWLKTYIFRVVKPQGIFTAVLTTYIISSLLHGFNLQIAIVLLSLGFYTYIEYKLRKKLATTFEACIESNRCSSSCMHKYKSQHPYVIITNVLMSIFTIAHLSYLGILVNDSAETPGRNVSLSHSLSKWWEVSFLSHWVFGFTYILYLSI